MPHHYKTISEHQAIYEKILANPEILYLLSTCIVAQDQKKLAEKLAALTGTLEERVVHDLGMWVGREEAPERLKEIMILRKKKGEELRSAKRRFIAELGLDWTAAERELYLKSAKVVVVEPLDQFYPPFGYWIVENDSIDKKWAEHIKTTKQPDQRKRRLETH